MRRFFVADDDEIRSGLVTDVYFDNTVAVLRSLGKDPQVVAEVRARTLPEGWPWAVLCGIEEVARLFEGIDGVAVHALPEGSLFRGGEPVLVLEGRYTAFARHETALLGLLCQASGIATGAARCRLAAQGRTVLSFGARRVHPALAPMIERAAYIGGAHGVSSVLGARAAGVRASGTMPHALVLALGDTVTAARAFDAAIDPSVPRIVLVDTLADEKFEAVAVAEALGERLAAVRLDTPGSRRGDFRTLIEEVRWELDLRGHRHVKIYASGNLGEAEIEALRDVADGFGVGAAIARAPQVDFGLDLVEVDGAPRAKRGKRSGRKDLWGCPRCGARGVVAAGHPFEHAPCGGTPERLLEPLCAGGHIVAELPPAAELRARVLDALAHLA